MNSDASRASGGPLVWRDMDQVALDRAYDQTNWAANIDSVAARRAQANAQALAHLGEPQVMAYAMPDGKHGEAQTFDLYRTRATSAPILVFIHGGGWRTGRARDYAWLAEPFVNAGAHFVALDFDSIDTCGGDLSPMVAQVRSAVAHVHRSARDFGGDPERIFVAGHSSGGHLAGNVVVTDWAADFGLPARLLRGGVLVSGMYDLAAVRLSARSKYVAFTDAMERELSAQRHLDRLACPLILAVGTQESPEFIRQTRDMAAAVEAAGKEAILILAEGTNHFEILEGLANPYGLLARPLLAMMGLGEALSSRGAR